MSTALSHAARVSATAAVSPVRRSPLALRLARAYARRAARTALDGVWVGGLRGTLGLLAEEPLIVAANHVSWWDPLMLVLLDEALGGNGAVLMDADNLRRLPYMRWLGAIPLERRPGASPLAGLRAGGAWLDRPGRVLFIFPQGRQRPAHLRPLGFQRGVSLLARMSGARVVPMALTYGWREAQHPSAALALGGVVEPSTDVLEAAVDPLLARLDRFLDGSSPAARPIGGDGALEALVAPSAARPDEGLGARLLAWASREPS
jgi:hypothetical protein